MTSNYCPEIFTFSWQGILLFCDKPVSLGRITLYWFFVFICNLLVHDGIYLSFTVFLKIHKNSDVAWDLV